MGAEPAVLAGLLWQGGAGRRIPCSAEDKGLAVHFDVLSRGKGQDVIQGSAQNVAVNLTKEVLENVHTGK